jgi:hypothetical protein
MPNFFESFLNQVNQKYKEADKATGGWLPGGGTASPVTRKAQELTRSITPVNIRDKIAIPLLDKGIESGILPAAPAMFGRYLSGTSNPLTVLPTSIKQHISRLVSQSSDYPELVNTQKSNTLLPVNWGYVDRGPSTLTLGSFTVDPRLKEVTDRYKFDDLATDTQEGNIYSDAQEGGLPASFLINFALNKGLITPQSGYNIQAKY